MKKSGSKAINSFKLLKGKCRLVHHSSKVHSAQPRITFMFFFFSSNKTEWSLFEVIKRKNMFPKGPLCKGVLRLF